MDSRIYNGNTSTFTTSSMINDITGLNCNSISNDAWLRIIPICSKVEVKFNFIDCRPRIGSEGIGVAIMDEFYQVVSLCYLFPSAGYAPKRLTLADLLPGKVYHMAIYTSFSGMRCSYQMQVEGIMTYGFDSSDMYGEFEIGEGSIVKYFVENPNSSTIYNWTADAGINIISGQGTHGVMIEAPNNGSYQICCEITYVNETVDQICKTVEVNTVAPIIRYEMAEYCRGDCYDFGNDCYGEGGVYENQTTNSQGRTVRQVLELCENPYPEAIIYGDGHVYINGCVNDITMRGGVLQSAGNVNYHWMKRGEGRIPDSEYEEFTTSEEGWYGFVVEDEASGCTDTAFVKVWVNGDCDSIECICESNFIIPDSSCAMDGLNLVDAEYMGCDEFVASTVDQKFIPKIEDCEDFDIGNPHWVNFVADSTVMEISFITWNCNKQNFAGIRPVILGPVRSIGAPGMLDCTIIDECQSHIFRSDEFVKGETYRIQVEGIKSRIWDGCDFAFYIGFQEPFFPLSLDRDSIISPQEYEPCVDTRLWYTAPEAERIIGYEWKIIEGSGAIVSGQPSNEIQIEWYEGGASRLRLIVTNNCLNKDTLFLDVPVKDLTVVNNLPPIEACPRDFPLAPNDYCGTSFCPGYIAEPGKVCIEIPIEGNYCDSIVCYTFVKSNEPRTIVDTFFCVGECLDWNGQQICSPGTFEFVNNIGNGCTNTLELRVRELMLPPPQITCITTINSIVFSWPSIPDAISYTISINGSPQGTVTSNSFTVDNLSPLQTVTIEVMANGTSCAGARGFSSCTTPACPTFDLQIEPIAPLCLGTGLQAIQLAFQQTGGIGNGVAQWSGQNVSSTGVFDPSGLPIGDYQIDLNYSEGNCNANENINLSIHPNYEFYDTLKLCTGDILSYNGIQIFSLGNYTIPRTTAFGCDSIFYLEVIPARDTVRNTTPQNICEGDTISLFGNEVFSSGVYSEIEDDGLCVKVESIEVFVNSNPETYDTISTCDGTLVSVFGNPTDIAGTYSEVFNSNQFCDSTHSITLEIQDTFNFFETANICLGDTIDFFGTPVFEQGNFQHIEKTIAGCDSIFNLRVFPSQDTAFDFQNENICPGDTILVFGNEVFEDGVFTEIEDNGFCVKVKEVEVKLGTTSETFDTISTCLGSSVSVFGNQTDIADTYFKTYNRFQNCDSTHSITILTRDTFYDFKNLEICPGQQANIFGNLISTAGIYEQKFLAVNGCDSMAIIELSVTDTLKTEEPLFVCENDSLEIFGAFENAPGLYEEAFSTLEGCDSLHTIDLRSNPIYNFFDTVNICLGDTIDFFGTPVFSQGDFQHIEQTAAGCDSIFNLEIVPSRDTAYDFQNENICPGDTILVFGNEVFDDGIFTDINDNGFCVSVKEVEVKVGTISEIFDTLSTCLGNPVSVFGNQTDVAGTYFETYNRFAKCDSIHAVTLLSRDTFYDSKRLEICPGQTADIFGVPVSTSGIYTQKFIAENGCDSTAIIELSVTDTLRSNEVINICQTDSIQIFGNYESLPGSYIQKTNSIAGCDSIHTILLEHYPDFSFMASAENTCFGDDSGIAKILPEQGTSFQYEWGNGSKDSIQSNLKAGMYYFTVTDENGCPKPDSVLVSDQFFEINWSEENPLCFGDANGSIEIVSATNNLQFSLNNGSFSTQNIFENLSSGSYQITARNANDCILETEIELVEPDLFTVSLPEDTILRIGHFIDLIPNIEGLPSNYSWRPDLDLDCADCPEVRAQPQDDITYFLEVQDENGCFAKDSIYIKINFGNKYFIPSAFSPNSDGINDFFTIFGNENLVEVEEFLIFDRWGELVWEGHNIPPNSGIGWDGTYKGKLLNSAVFVFYTVLKFEDGSRIEEKGDITLRR